MASSRFPGKPLTLIGGRPMLEHVYRRTTACTLLDDVIIATCDREIAAAARNFGARVVMTSPAHERASERVAEASATDEADIIVMVQGDEPMIRPEMIATALTPLLADPTLGCANLVSPIRSEHELRDSNTIKTVMALDGSALYFSRAPVPATMDGSFALGACFKQVCVIPFRRAILQRFPSLSPADSSKRL
jgi:3-deoxy-manno-octulosonate cytidylyltransferase (CMP-KDO synthetase)